jgi:flagellar basal body-associated protein FliL
MAKAAVKKKVEEPAEDAAEAQEEQKGGKGKLIIIAAAAVCLLIAGGAGTYLYLAHPKKQEEAAAKKEDTLPVEEAPILVKVENIVAPLTKNGDVVSYVYIDVNLEVADEPLVQQIKDNMPRLRNVIAQDLYDRSIADPKEPSRADVSGIQTRLLSDAKQVFGAESVKQVYILQAHYYPA